MDTNTKNIYNYSSPVVIAGSCVLIIAGIVAARAIIAPLILAIFVSIICAQPVAWLVRKKVPRALSIFLVLIGLFALVGVIGLLIGASLRQFSNNIPFYAGKLNSFLETGLKDLNLSEIGLTGDYILERFEISRIFGLTAGAIGEVISLLSSSFIILLITIFILAETNAFGIKAKLLEKTYGKSLYFLSDFRRSVRRYLSLKTMISLFTGAFITVWLTIIGVDFALLWGVLAFFLNFIPNIGSIIAAIPATLLALVQFGIEGALLTVSGFFIVNTLFGNIIEPRILGRGLSLSPLMVFLSLILWGAMLGIIGMFLAVPLTLILKIWFDQNEGTKWISILMSSEKDAKKLCEQKSCEQ